MFCVMWFLQLVDVCNVAPAQWRHHFLGFPISLVMTGLLALQFLRVTVTTCFSLSPFFWFFPPYLLPNFFFCLLLMPFDLDENIFPLLLLSLKTFLSENFYFLPFSALFFSFSVVGGWSCKSSDLTCMTCPESCEKKPLLCPSQKLWLWRARQAKMWFIDMHMRREKKAEAARRAEKNLSYVRYERAWHLLCHWEKPFLWRKKERKLWMVLNGMKSWVLK